MEMKGRRELKGERRWRYWWQLRLNTKGDIGELSTNLRSSNSCGELAATIIILSVRRPDLAQFFTSNGNSATHCFISSLTHTSICICLPKNLTNALQFSAQPWRVVVDALRCAGSNQPQQAASLLAKIIGWEKVKRQQYFLEVFILLIYPDIFNLNFWDYVNLF